MRGVNKVIIVGHLGADPEHRTFPNGGSVTNISVATSEQWNDKQTGEKREATEWHRIVLHNRLGEVAAQYLRKGNPVYIEGSLRTRKWQDQNGQDRYTTEIRADNMQMLGNANSGYQGGGMGQANTFAGQSGGYVDNQNQTYQNTSNQNYQGYQNNQDYQQTNNLSQNQPNSFANPNNQMNNSQHTGFNQPINPPQQANPSATQLQNNKPNPNSVMPMSDTPADDDIPF